MTAPTRLAPSILPLGASIGNMGQHCCLFSAAAKEKALTRTGEGEEGA